MVRDWKNRLRRRGKLLLFCFLQTGYAAGIDTDSALLQTKNLFVVKWCIDSCHSVVNCFWRVVKIHQDEGYTTQSKTQSKPQLKIQIGMWYKGVTQRCCPELLPCWDKEAEHA